MTKEQLEKVLAEGVGPDRYLSEEDLLAAGVPRRFVKELSTATKRMATPEDAAEIAEDFARRMAAEQERSFERDPAKLAADVPQTF